MGIAFPKYFWVDAIPLVLTLFAGNSVPPNDVRTRENDNTVVFHQLVLKRNAKSIVKVNSAFIVIYRK